MRNVILMLAALAPAGALHAQAATGGACARVQQVVEQSQSQVPAGSPDFSAIDSRVKAEDLFRSDSLGKLYLMPLEFGGADVDPNIVYVPHWVVALKTDLDQNVIRPLIEEEQISTYGARPEYQGRSFIPSAITIIASDPGEFSYTINIWGEALARDDNTAPDGPLCRTAD